MSHTVRAFSRTETSDAGRLTRQFFSDCCNAISAKTAWPAGFFGGAMMIQDGELGVSDTPAARSIVPPRLGCRGSSAPVPVSSPRRKAVAGGRKSTTHGQSALFPWRRATRNSNLNAPVLRQPHLSHCDCVPPHSTLDTHSRTPSAFCIAVRDVMALLTEKALVNYEEQEGLSALYKKLHDVN